MQAGVWFKFLFGQADAIRQLAASRATLWTGIALVLLTSVPRNYDQTFLSENPFRWIFGPLLFSLVSGTWLYFITYAWFARREMAAPGDPKPTEDGGWLSFMGLFWMTAPVAWLYAIPVERFMDSISATQANIALLSLVSFWRVALMARVLQVTTKAPFGIALVWVLFAASVEVLVVFFFGGGLAKAIMAGMGGMRNSPEEQILFDAMSTAFMATLWIAPISFVAALVWRTRRLLEPLPCPIAAPVRWPALAIAACLWIAVAIVPQRELANTVKVERLLAGEHAREALDVLARHQPGDFAPARTLPPKPFEWSLFTQLPECFDAIRESDPEWVRTMMMRRLDTMISHAGSRWGRRIDTTQPRSDQIENIQAGLHRYGSDAEGLVKLLNGLHRLPEGEPWLKTNSLFIEAVWKMVTDNEWQRYGSAKTPNLQNWHVLVLSNLLKERFPTHTQAMPKDAPPSPRP